MVNNTIDHKPVEPVDPVMSGCEIVSMYDWDHQIARAVCLAESKGNANAKNHKGKHKGCIGSFGLMQIACIHTGGVPEYDPHENMKVAYQVYNNRLKWDSNGWNAWGAYTNGSYKDHLN